MEFKEKLKLLRKEKNLTQKQFCDKTGISISALRNYEAGRLPETSCLKNIKDFFDVPYEYLIDNNIENKNYNNVDIGKKLKLSDKTINKITKINTIDTKLLSDFVDNIPVLDFWNKLNEFKEICKTIYLLDDLSCYANTEIFKLENYITDNNITNKEYINLEKKHSLNYLATYTDLPLSIDFNKFYSENNCKYDNKSEILASLNLFNAYLKSLSIKKIDLDVEIMPFYTITSSHMEIIENFIKNDSLISKQIVSNLLNEINRKINELSEKKDLLNYYISKTLNEYLDIYNNVANYKSSYNEISEKIKEELNKFKSEAEQ